MHESADGRNGRQEGGHRSREPHGMDIDRLLGYYNYQFIDTMHARI
jgi:hypothetical protein